MTLSFTIARYKTDFIQPADSDARPAVGAMQRLKRADIVIAGGGWVGLAMAKEITSRTSLSVVVLERGPLRKMADYATAMDEVDTGLRNRLAQSTADETVTHRHSVSGTAVPMRQYGSFNPGTGVGGSGEQWSGLSYRYLPDLFRLATTLREKHGAKLPADLAVQDWGVTYDELEPMYWRAEQMMGICGKAGNRTGAAHRGRQHLRGSAVTRISESAAPIDLSDDAVSKGGSGSGLSSLPHPGGHAQQDLPESGWHHALGLRVLRILHALRLYDRREGATHEHAAAAAGKAR